MDKNQIRHLTNHSEESEKSIERYLVRRAEEIGLPCLKYSNPCMVGYPDRLLVLPDCAVVWVELKSKGRKPSKMQSLRIAELLRLGHIVRVIDTKAGVDDLMRYIGETEITVNFTQV